MNQIKNATLSTPFVFKPFTFWVKAEDPACFIYHLFLFKEMGI